MKIKSLFIRLNRLPRQRRGQRGEIASIIALIGLGIVTVGIIAGRTLVREGPRDIPQAQTVDRPNVCVSSSITNKIVTSATSTTITLNGAQPTAYWISKFRLAFYNLDNLYGPGNPKPILVNGAALVKDVAVTGSTTTSKAISVAYSEVHKLDSNWGNKYPVNIQVNGYFFLNDGRLSAADPDCVESFSLATATPTSAPNCIDTDGGKNYTKYGETYISGSNSKLVDSCSLQNGVSTLQEGYCTTSGTVASVAYTCTSGCSNGACTGITPTKSPTPIPGVACAVPKMTGSAYCSGTQAVMTWSWNAVSGVTKYQFQRDDNTDFSSPAETITVNAPTTSVQRTLPAGMWWRARIRVLEANQCSVPTAPQWSNVIGVGPCDGPTLTPTKTPTKTPTPVVKACAAPTNVTATLSYCEGTFATVQWKWGVVSGASLYRFQLDNNSDFSSPAVNVTTSLPQRLTSAIGAGTWYGRVRVNTGTSCAAPGAYTTKIYVNNCGPTKTPTKAPTKTPTKAPTKTPTPVVKACAAPTNVTATLSYCEGTFATVQWKWGVVSGASLYRFQLDNNSDFSSPAVNVTTSLPQRLTSAIGAGTWYGRVRVNTGTSCAAPGAYTTKIYVNNCGPTKTPTKSPTKSPTPTNKPGESCVLDLKPEGTIYTSVGQQTKLTANVINLSTVTRIAYVEIKSSSVGGVVIEPADGTSQKIDERTIRDFNPPYEAFANSVKVSSTSLNASAYASGVRLCQDAEALVVSASSPTPSKIPTKTPTKSPTKSPTPFVSVKPSNTPVLTQPVGNETVFFQPASGNLPPNTAFKVMVNSSTKTLAFGRVVVTFDKSKVNLASEITTNPNLSTIVEKTTMANANANGKAIIVIASSPTDSQPTGSFEFASLTFKTIVTAQATSAVNFLSSDMQLVDGGGGALTIKAGSLSLSLNGGASVQPTQSSCVRGPQGNLDCSFDGCIDTADFELFRQAFGLPVSQINVPPGQYTPDLIQDAGNLIDTADYEILRSNFGSCS